MISLKKYLDDLAGPDHPFVKGVSLEDPRVRDSKETQDSIELLEQQAVYRLNKFLRVNKN